MQQSAPQAMNMHYLAPRQMVGGRRYLYVMAQHSQSFYDILHERRRSRRFSHPCYDMQNLHISAEANHLRAII